MRACARRGRCKRPPANASECFIFPLLRNRPSQRNSRALARCLSMCQMKREKKKIRETDDLAAPHDLLPVIHKGSLLPSLGLFFFYLLNAAHRRSGADILGGVIPGVESLRSPCCDPVILGRGRVLEACRERKRLYQKHILPRGCITAAIWLQIKRCTHKRTHTCAAICAQM